MVLRYVLNRKLPHFSQRKSDETFEVLDLGFKDFIYRCLEVDPAKRATVVELLSHQIFEGVKEPERELSLQSFALSKKPKAKIVMTSNHTPEPNSYLKIFEKKKSPNNRNAPKFTEEVIKMKKFSPKSNKNIEKNYLLPDISRKEQRRKSSSKYMKKMLEIRTDNKSFVKQTESPPPVLKSRNPSLSYEVSNESLMKSSFANAVMSNRHQNLHKKEQRLNSPGHFQSNMVLPFKYRVKKNDTRSNHSRFLLVDRD
jgi:serine/threonine protein kinase